MKIIGTLVVGLGVSLMAASTVRAGWLSNLNPFASKQSSNQPEAIKSGPPGSSASLTNALGSGRYNTKVASGPSGSNGGSTIVPQLNGKPIRPVNSVTPASSSGPSLLSRIGAAPANLFAKTKSLFSKSQPAPTPKQRMLGKPSGGSQFTHSGSAAVKQQTTASQFFSRPRPGY